MPALLPLAPTLVSPENGTYEDTFVLAPTFSWIYNAGDPTSGTTQSAWAFQRVTNGGLTQYWNGTSWQSTIVWNSGFTTTGNPTFTYNFAVGWADANVYQWAVATQDTNGQGPFSSLFTLNAQAQPNVVVSQPTGTITTADPLISWASGVPSGAAQISYRVLIYTAAQWALITHIGDSPFTYDSGTIGGTAQTYSLANVPFYLPNNTSYYAAVIVTETGGQSHGGYNTFSTAYSQPSTPTITATPTTDPSTGYPVIELVVQGNDNLLPLDDANPTLGLGTWKNDNNCTVSSTASGLQMKANAAGNMAAETATGTSGTPVQPNTEYTAIASLKAAATGRSIQLSIAWYNSSGSLISTTTGTAGSDNTSSPTQITATNPSSPSTAAYATIIVNVLSAALNEIHDVTQIGLFLGTTTTWAAGGFVGFQQVIIQRSDGLYVRGASISNPANLSASNQQLEASTWGPAGAIYDYEAIQHISYTYTAQTAVDVGGAPNATVVSGTSTSGAATVAVSGNKTWWEIDPTNPPSAANIQFIAWTPVTTEQSTAHQVTGQTTMNIVADTVMNQDFAATAEMFADTDYTTLVALLNSQHTIFISSGWGAIDSGYFRVGPQTGGMSSGVGNQTKNTTLQPSVYGGGHRTVALTAVAQPRPPV